MTIGRSSTTWGLADAQKGGTGLRVTMHCHRVMHPHYQ